MNLERVSLRNVIFRDHSMLNSISYVNMDWIWNAVRNSNSFRIHVSYALLTHSKISDTFPVVPTSEAIVVPMCHLPRNIEQRLVFREHAAWSSPTIYQSERNVLLPRKAILHCTLHYQTSSLFWNNTTHTINNRKCLFKQRAVIDKSKRIFANLR